MPTNCKFNSLPIDSNRWKPAEVATTLSQWADLSDIESDDGHNKRNHDGEQLIASWRHKACFQLLHRTDQNAKQPKLDKFGS